MEALNVFGGTGFVGSNFMRRHGGILQTRDRMLPNSRDVLYFISTTDNYNVFADVHIDIDTNLRHLVGVLDLWRRYANTSGEGIFNFVSSWFVYGECNMERGAREDDHCNPRGFYSITKRTAEQLLISYCETFGLKYRILRLSNVIGPDAPFSPKKNALQFLIDELAHDRPINIYDDGIFYRDYIHVQDAVDAIDHIINISSTKNQIYNIGSGNLSRFGDALKYCARRLDSKSIITSTQQPEFHKTVQAKSFFMNVDKLRLSNFQYRFLLRDTLDQIVDKYLDERQQDHSDSGHTGSQETQRERASVLHRETERT